MALSFESNWDTLSHLNPDPVPFHELLGLYYDPFESSDFPNDSSFHSPESIPLPSLNHSSLSSPDLYPPREEFDISQCPKRPRSCSDFYPTSELLFDATSYLMPEFVAPRPEKKTSNGCLSAQSVAARQRRKRISEKTQELGRLIPGGNKMNTAEMFQAAYKYVKFMQAQVGVLALMGPIQGEKLQLLLGSTNVQEKLYGEEKCLVPKEVVETMAKDKDIKSSALISRDLDRFMDSMG
ncbi:transcription factor bHLH52-like isoform X1 [Typha angustifolia]|uniref:transcription factor bHLH52-like isoform X1 n=1 Tax=Typha angustifolia TaxID=59011 RepID=UPI003C2F3BC2